MSCMLLAEPAVLLDLHPVGMSLLILCSIVVPVLAFCARKCYPCTHDDILRYAFAFGDPSQKYITGDPADNS